MKGLGRSIRYWFFYMEQTFLVLLAVGAVVSTFQVYMLGEETANKVVSAYIPMMGCISIIAILMSAATYFIPQSLSSGGTRKEIFAGMELVVHGILFQMLLIAIVLQKIFYPNNSSINLISICTIQYLFCCGIGNLLCAASLKNEKKSGMVIYIIVVVVIAVGMTMISISTVPGKKAFITIEESYQGIEYIILLGSILLDIIMMAGCYLSIRKYEVR